MSEHDLELSRLYRAASAEEPPAAVDAAILAAARRRAAKPARALWTRWTAPASALATLVLAVALAFLVEREQPRRFDDTRSTPPRGAPPAPGGDAAKPAAADRVAPPPAVQAQPPARASGEGANKREAEAPAPAAPVAAPAPAAAPAAAMPAPTPAPLSSESATQAFPAERRDRSAEVRAKQETGVAESARDGAGASGPAVPAAAGAPTPSRPSALQRSPESWLAEISRLKRAGRDQEAAQQLAQFRKAYPDYALPEDLRGP